MTAKASASRQTRPTIKSTFFQSVFTGCDTWANGFGGMEEDGGGSGGGLGGIKFTAQLWRPMVVRRTVCVWRFRILSF